MGAQESSVSAMTRYSRSVIPGRAANEGGATEMDRMVFGTKGRDAANDEDEDSNEMPPHEVDMLIQRATGDRRQGQRRRNSDKLDFAPLPDEAKKMRRSEGSNRGPLILAGALVVVALFGVVVWNAYRDGVRSDDSAAAPVLADAGAFKRPADIVKPAATNAEGSVFDQVEGKPNVDPAPEVRSEPTPPPVQAAKVETPKPAVTKPAVAKTVETKPVETKTVAAPPPAPKAAAPVAAAPTVATNLVPAPAPLKTPAPVQANAAPAAQPELVGGFKPVFAKDGKYIVQIGAPSSEAAANAEWDKRARTAPELFSAAERLIQRADVNGKTVYRVRAGSFATGADADSFCNAFKAKGGQCYRAAK